MSRLMRTVVFAVPVIGTAVAIAIHSGASEADDPVAGQEAFPQGQHYLLPPPFPLLSDPDRDHASEQVAYGAVNDTEVLEQPIAYSHALHAGELQIECEYCHFNARRSRHAGVPSSATCGNCHNHDGYEGTGEAGDESAIPAQGGGVSSEGRPELVRLAEFIESGSPIPWRRVHDLPDFVYFTHSRHITAGLECQECHGEVQDTMTVASRVSELTMGWCLDCHEDHPAVDENYGQRAELRRAEIKDCWTCHQ